MPARRCMQIASLTPSCCSVRVMSCYGASFRYGALGDARFPSLGGSDPDNLTLRLIETFPRISVPDLEITVVAGGSNPQLAELRRRVAELDLPIHLVGNASNMPDLMAQSDVAIICAGGTLWELLYMGCAT